MRKKVLIILSLSCLLGACRYEEGPFMNFTPVKDRIRGQWKVNAVQKNGVSTTTESPGVAENLNNYFSFYITKRLQIDYWDYADDNNTSYNTTICQADGTYDFSSDKKEIIASFSDKYRSYNRTYEILKFKNKELKLKFKDDDNTEWILELTLIQSFIPYEM
ncbi:MAG: hypothetical protein FWH36_06195 [Lentimicrobiaceae bacterium]|nr:hypothetical protein [Lentimicrobiaceae bacterium]